MFIVYSKPFHNIQKLKTAQISINNSLDKLLGKFLQQSTYPSENKLITANRNKTELSKRDQAQKRIYIKIPSCSGSEIDQINSGARGQGNCYLQG